MPSQPVPLLESPTSLSLSLVFSIQFLIADQTCRAVQSPMVFAFSLVLFVSSLFYGAHPCPSILIELFLLQVFGFAKVAGKMSTCYDNIFSF
jgi:hypothetical protein